MLVGLVFLTDDRRCAEVLEKELIKRREKFPIVTLKFRKKVCTENFLFIK